MPFVKISVIFFSIFVLMQIALPFETNKTIGLYESLYNAIEMDNGNEVRQFIAFGADVDYRYKGGKTPLMHASSLGSLNAVITLLELGANIDLVSKEDLTAIDYARNANDENILAILQVSVTPKEVQSQRQLIATIQFYLNRLGYIAGDIDGVFGIKTRKSLRQFSIDHKQPFTPEISSRQIEVLYDVMITPEFIPTFKQNDNKTYSSSLKKVNTTDKSLDLVNF